MDPVNVSDPTLWTTLGGIFGAGGLGLMVALGISVYFNKLQSDDRKELNARLKEKDETCAKEMLAAETRWETRFQQMRGDIKEGFGIVADHTKEITILTAAVTNTRSREN